ncbi:MAG: hypothetical protein GWO81_02635, partial [Verrucomicrobia bacterium]|nr:hypothetical protein [Verrucomicrobiota bacterium]
MAKYHSCILLGAAALLGACKQAPKAQPLPELAPPSKWQAPKSTSGTLSVNWLQDLGDPQLRELATEALKNNANLRATAGR